MRFLSEHNVQRARAGAARAGAAASAALERRGLGPNRFDIVSSL